MNTVTRFVVKRDNLFYSNLHGLTPNIWEATFYREKPEVVDGDNVVMYSIDYKEMPYEV